MDARQLIDFAADDNGKDFREGLYAAIYDKVNAHIEAKKQEVAHNLVTQEEKEVEKEKEDHEDEKEDEALVKKMVKKDALKSEETETSKEEQLDESTRKHFQMVADIIKSHDNHDKRKELAQHHATIFAAQNPRFDRAKFMKAANVQE